MIDDMPNRTRYIIADDGKPHYIALDDDGTDLQAYNKWFSIKYEEFNPDEWESIATIDTDLAIILKQEFEDRERQKQDLLELYFNELNE